ncbi:MAG: DUF1697 domain-containing protein [Anaerolineaceae bacterium]|nr:DUF1697 domain-containing protein [Anaerolineaceae bacterium]
MPVYISLLRGINVGGNKKIRMAELKALYESLGFTNVQTLLQSGNVIFETAADPAQLAAQIEAGVFNTFGFESKIILRTCADLRAVVEHAPYTAEQLAEPSKALVTFLATAPGDTAIQTLLNDHQGPEVLQVVGQELFVFYTDGAGRSKLTNVFIEKRLKTTGTARNWNTILKLLNLCGES